MKKKFLILIIGIYSKFIFASLPTIPALIEESKKVNWENSVSRSILIDAPIEKVWDYVSDSTKAIEWSIYFHHISPLPSEFKDGSVGSLRRCFRQKDELGQRWDEVIIAVDPQKSRQLVTYNFHEYGWSFLTDSSYVFVRQLYRPVSSLQTELTFQTITPPRFVPFQWIVFKLVQNETSTIFGKNLENIKAALEGKERLYPWVSP